MFDLRKQVALLVTQSPSGKQTYSSYLIASQYVYNSTRLELLVCLKADCDAPHFNFWKTCVEHFCISEYYIQLAKFLAFARNASINTKPLFGVDSEVLSQPGCFCFDPFLSNNCSPFFCCMQNNICNASSIGNKGPPPGPQLLG